MKNLLRIGLSTVIVTTSVSLCPTSATNEGKFWVMDRENALGHEVIYAGQKAVKIFFPETGFGIITAAPTWNIIWFNTRLRQQFSCTLKEYRVSKGLSPEMGRAPDLLKVSTEYAGAKSIKIIQRESNRRSASQISGLSDTGKVHRPFVRQSDYFILDQSELPKEALDFLCTYFGMPNFGGIPLAHEEEMSDGKVLKTWYTKKVEKKAVPDSAFAFPVGYKKLSSPASLSIGDDTHKLEDMVTDMGLGDAFGKKH